MARVALNLIQDMFTRAHKIPLTSRAYIYIFYRKKKEDIFQIAQAYSYFIKNKKI